MSGTSRARLPLVPLSARPPGDGVVWRRTFHVQSWVSMSLIRQPDTSPMRAPVQAAKMTTSPQPRKWSADRATRASASRVQGCPVGEGEGTRIIELVLGLAELVLPTGDASGVAIDDSVAHGLVEYPDEYRQAVLDRRAAAFVSDPAVDGPVDGAVSDHADREVTQGGDDTTTPAGQVGIERLGLQAPCGERHDGLAVLVEGHGCGDRGDSVGCQSLERFDPALGCGFGSEGLGLGSAFPRCRLDPTDPGAVGLSSVRAMLDVCAQRDAERKIRLRAHAADPGSVRRLRSHASTSSA